MFVAPIKSSITEIKGPTVTNIHQDREEDRVNWLVIKEKNRKPPNNKAIYVGEDINVKSSILVKEYLAKILTHKKEKEKSINIIDLDHNKRKARNP